MSIIISQNISFHQKRDLLFAQWQILFPFLSDGHFGEREIWFMTFTVFVVLTSQSQQEQVFILLLCLH